MDHVITLLSAAQDSASHIILAEIPNPGTATAPPGVGEKFLQVLSWAKWVCFGIAILGIMIIGAMMAINSRRGEGGEKLGALGWALCGVVLIAGAFTIVGFIVGEDDSTKASMADTHNAVIAIEQVHTDE